VLAGNVGHNGSLTVESIQLDHRFFGLTNGNVVTVSALVNIPVSALDGDDDGSLCVVVSVWACRCQCQYVGRLIGWAVEIKSGSRVV
jgi:hypothetical protein